MKRHDMDIEGAGAWNMPSKLREVHVQRPCGWEPGMFKKAKKSTCQELIGQRRKRGEKRLEGQAAQGLEGHGKVSSSCGGRARRVRLSRSTGDGTRLTTLRLSCSSPFLTSLICLGEP